MIEKLKSAELRDKVGGRFKLTALVQKRMAELVQGSRPLIDDIEGLTLMEIVVQEIIEDKISYEGAPSAGDKGASSQ